MSADFQEITIVDLDVRKTTWSRVHSSMRTLYLKLSREPDQAWPRFFFEDRASRVEIKRHGLWIEEGYIVFDCLLEDVDSHHLPDIRQSVAYANRRSRELAEARRAESERALADTRNEQQALDDLRARIRGGRGLKPESATAAPEPALDAKPDLPTAQKLELELGPPLQLEPPIQVLAADVSAKAEPADRSNLLVEDALPPAPEPEQRSDIATADAPAPRQPPPPSWPWPEPEQRSQVLPPAPEPEQRSDIATADVPPPPPPPPPASEPEQRSEALPPAPEPEPHRDAQPADVAPPAAAVDSMEAAFEERRRDWRTRFRVALALASAKKENERGHD